MEEAEKTHLEHLRVQDAARQCFKTMKSSGRLGSTIQLAPGHGDLVTYWPSRHATCIEGTQSYTHRIRFGRSTAWIRKKA